MMDMNSLLDRVREDNFQALSGTAIDGRLPVPEKILNEVALVALKKYKGAIHIENLRLLVKENNRVDVSFKAKWKMLTKQFNFPLSVEKNVRYQDGLRIRLWLPENYKSLGLLLDLMNTIFKYLPTGISIAKRLIDVNLSVLFQNEEFYPLLAFVQSAEIETESGRIWVQFQISIPKVEHAIQ